VASKKIENFFGGEGISTGETRMSRTNKREQPVVRGFYDDHGIVWRVEDGMISNGDAKWRDTVRYGTIVCIGVANFKHANGWKKNRKTKRLENAKAKEILCEREGQIIFENTSVDEPYNPKAYPDALFAERNYDF